MLPEVRRGANPDPVFVGSSGYQRTQNVRKVAYAAYADWLQDGARTILPWADYCPI